MKRGYYNFKDGIFYFMSFWKPKEDEDIFVIINNPNPACNYMAGWREGDQFELKTVMNM